MTRKRKSMEFRTLKRLCCDEMGIVDDAERCWKKHYSVECNARNCPAWALLPDAIDAARGLIKERAELEKKLEAALKERLGMIDQRLALEEVLGGIFVTLSFCAVPDKLASD
ncbi:MAG: hypothetical protein GY854_21745 [Deltaproteobacteria bacterium]|nr:hypothetical protein [Deltaproteobacteria bacterium]